MVKNVFKLFGRFLLATMLISSAYVHLSDPQIHEQTFKSNTNKILSTSQIIGAVLKIPKSTNWILFVKLFGVFEALIALLIFVGDIIGAHLLFIYLIASFINSYIGDISNGQILQWSPCCKYSFLRQLCIIGFSLVLLAEHKKTKSQFKKDTE